MKTLRNLFLTAAVVSFAALPAMSSTMLLDEGTDVLAAETQSTSLGNSEFIGNTVVSADGLTVGTVSSVSLDQDGSWKLWIELADGLVSGTDAFMMNVDAGTQATGLVAVPMSEADLITTLNNQTQS